MSYTQTIKLPRKHAQDWLSRYDGDDATEVESSARTITLDLSREALRDLISDALYYAEEMDPSNTGDIDYRPAARTLLRALDRIGVTYTRRSFTVTLVGTCGYRGCDNPTTKPEPWSMCDECFES